MKSPADPVPIDHRDLNYRMRPFQRVMDWLFSADNTKPFVEAPKEEPCTETGANCEWEWCCDSCQDMACRRCFRTRDFTKDEYEP